MKIALKEWAAVIRALELGKQIFLLRKGGLAETHLGFELKHPRFVFYPTWEHQQREQLKPQFRPWFDELEPKPGRNLTISALAEASSVLEAPADRERWRHADDLHIWSDDYLRMRYEYRPDLPLRIVLLRAYRLQKPVQITDDRRYGGCRSWVDLNEEVAVNNAQPALTDRELETSRKRLCDALAVDCPGTAA